MPTLNQTYITISKAANLIGVTTKTLRRWEERGLLKPYRNSYQQRLYDPIILQSLKNRKYQPLPTHPQKVSPYLKPGEAARTLGISIKTLRRWEKSGKLTCLRNHLNQRVFNRQEVHRLKYQLSKKPDYGNYAPINQFYTPYLAPFLLLILYLPLVSLLIHTKSSSLENNLILSPTSLRSTPIKNPENEAFQSPNLTSLPGKSTLSHSDITININNPEILPTPTNETSAPPSLSTAAIGLSNRVTNDLSPHTLPDNLPISNFSLPSTNETVSPISL